MFFLPDKKVEKTASLLPRRRGYLLAHSHKSAKQNEKNDTRSLWLTFTGLLPLFFTVPSFNPPKPDFASQITVYNNSMDTCILRSKIFSKTTSDLVPTPRIINPKSSSSPSFIRFRSTSRLNFTSISPIRCKLGRSSSTNDDERSPTISGDWRSFRAHLVFTEQSSTTSSNQNPNPSTPVTPPSQTPNPKITSKWAHPIHQPEKGCLLIATDKLDGVHIFERTVILLLSTGPIGPTGIILNRPSLMSIKETRSSVLDVAGTFSDRPLYFGGPLEEGLFLLSSGAKSGARAGSGVFEEVMDGMYYGTKETVGCAAEMVKRGVVGLEDFVFFDGYCGWEEQQLRNEIRAGYWAVVACSPSVIGAQNGSGLREEVLALMGPKKVW